MMLKNRALEQHDKTATYKNLKKVHTIIFFENSDRNLISERDEKLYFHVGKTTFNTGINLELLQDYILISLDTFKKYRYSDIIKGDTQITKYDYDSQAYKSDMDDEMKQKRLMYLSLFVTESVKDLESLMELYPGLSGIVNDMNVYMTRPREALNMYSEALSVLDRNSMDLLIDEMRDRLNEETARADDAEDRADNEKARADETESKLRAAEAELAKLRAELAKKSG